MKTRKRMYALTLAIVLVMSIMAIPVSAAARTSEFAAFLTISANNGSANPGYTRALQRFLMCIDSTNKDAIMNSGGTDGKFGNTTAKLTKNFQKKSGLSQDGIVGRSTWTAMENSLSVTVADSSGTTWYNSNGNVIFGYAYGMASRYISCLDTGDWSKTYFHETK